MKKLLLLSFAVLLAFTATAQKITGNHEPWDQLLQKYVDDKGMVDYTGISKDPGFTRYLSMLENEVPDAKWSREAAMAYWINAYNAFTIQLMVQNMPIKSIMDIDKAWDKPFIKLKGKPYSLNQIEHEILRKQYFDPRIHFAVNCASFSCPPLYNRAFTATNLERVLDMLARKFINDPQRNKLSGSSAQVSKLFDWYAADFTKTANLISYLNKYAEKPLAKNATITFMEYNWSSNAKQR